MTELHGFSPPFSPAGEQLVPSPPWQFTIFGIYLQFEVDADAFRRWLPRAFTVDRPIVEIAFCDSVALGSKLPEQHVSSPADTNFRECLVKLRASFAERVGWYVAYSWVDSDVSLVRGHLQGFPKRLGSIAMTRAEEPFGLGGGRRAGARLGASLTGSSGVQLRAIQTCEAEVAVEQLPALPFLLVRQHAALPGDGLSERLQICEPVVDEAERRLAWTGAGELECRGFHAELVPLLTPIGPVSSCSYWSRAVLSGSRELAVIDRTSL